MSHRYVVGVDGGGTKTDCVLVRDDGVPIDYLQWGPTSHEFLDGGMEAARREIHTMVHTLLTRNELDASQIAGASFGLAGVDSAYQERQLTAIVRQTGLSSYEVMNDGYLGIYAGTDCGVGAAIINGTGCSLTGIGGDGSRLQLGGQSIIMDDIAGGNIIGRNVIRLVFQDLVLREEPTVLTELLCRRLETSRTQLFEELMERVGAGELELKQLAPLLFEAVGAGDEPASRYLRKTGEDMARYLCALVDRLALGGDREPVQVVLIGSVFLRASNSTHVQALKETAGRALGEDRIVWKPLEVRPVCGAVAHALAKTGFAFALPTMKQAYLRILDDNLSGQSLRRTGKEMQACSV